MQHTLTLADIEKRGVARWRAPLHACSDCFHFTPTYSSWLNQVELWFAKIQRDLLAHGIFTSVADLARKIRKYIRAYANVARPFRWSYADPARRIIPNPMTGTAY